VEAMISRMPRQPLTAAERVDTQGIRRSWATKVGIEIAIETIFDLNSGKMRLSDLIIG
jgi:hypothetical protein